MLAEYTLEQLPNETEMEFRKKPVLFRGEQMFTSMLLAVTQPKPLLACFLEGHGEHQVDNGDEHMGYLELANLFRHDLDLGDVARQHLKVQAVGNHHQREAVLQVAAGHQQVVALPALQLENRPPGERR